MVVVVVGVVSAVGGGTYSVVTANACSNCLESVGRVTQQLLASAAPAA